MTWASQSQIILVVALRALPLHHAYAIASHHSNLAVRRPTAFSRLPIAPSLPSCLVGPATALLMSLLSCHLPRVEGAVSLLGTLWMGRSTAVIDTAMAERLTVPLYVYSKYASKMVRQNT